MQIMTQQEQNRRLAVGLLNWRESAHPAYGAPPPHTETQLYPDFFRDEAANAMLLDKLPPDTVIHFKCGLQHDTCRIGVPIRPNPQTQINHRNWTEDKDRKTAICLAALAMIEKEGK